MTAPGDKSLRILLVGGEKCVEKRPYPGLVLTICRVGKTALARELTAMDMEAGKGLRGDQTYRQLEVSRNFTPLP